jgi:chitin disaccharide deacetylase
MQQKHICICADDFGLSSSINQGIIELIAINRISAVSCMVYGTKWHEGLSALLNLKQNNNDNKIDIGLHLDLIDTVKINTSKKLVNLIIHSYLRKLNKQEIIHNIKIQLDKFEHDTNQIPDYIDGHQHIHQFPIIRDILIQELLQRYTDKLPWIRCTSTQKFLANLNFKAQIIDFLGSKQLKILAHKHGFFTNSHLIGVYNFSNTTDYEKKYAHWLKFIQHKDLLMCHPAKYIDNNDAISQARLNEFNFLSSAAFTAMLDKFNLSIAPLF